MIPKFPLTTMGHSPLRTHALFRERQLMTKSFFKDKDESVLPEPPVFNLKDEHDDPNEEEEPCLSLKKLYIEEMDPTEYRFAMKIFGTWRQWERLTECKWFIPILNEWRKELSLALRAENIQHLRTIAAEGGPKGLNAAKFLSKMEWLDTFEEKKGRGRPSKQEKEAYMKQEMETENDTLEELNRLGLGSFNGN